MTTKSPSSLTRLFARARLYATAAAFVAVSAQAATAAPLTQSYSFTEFDSTFAAFNTNLGTLLGIDISLDTAVSAINPLSAQGTCIANFIGGGYAVNAPGGSPTLLSLTGDGNVNFNCGQFEVVLAKHASASLDASLFSAFSAAGVSPITLVQTIVGGTVAVVQGSGIRDADTIWDPRLTSGLVTYTYCPVGETCTADPPPPTVPEPATATMLAFGLASLLASRRARR